MHNFKKYISNFLFLIILIPALNINALYSSPSHDAEEVIVISLRNQRSFEQQPSRVEVLGGEEINEKANMKPGDIRMLLNEITGIHVQQTSPISFNSSIRIQGLNGKYTQILRDGMPLYGGFSSGLGLLQIAPLDLKQVEVIKGANSTLYGGGAIAGLVNLISKKPTDENEHSFLINKTSSKGIDLSSYSSIKNEAIGATIFTSFNQSDAFDPAKNGFSAIPKFDRWTFNPRIFFEGAKSELKIGLNAIQEDRLGGYMQYVNKKNNVPAYFEQINTDRLSSQIEYIRELNSGNEIVFKNSINHYKQEHKIPTYFFAGTQTSSFSELHLLGASQKLDWVIGINLWTEKFDQEKPDSLQNLDLKTETWGLFTQGTFLINDYWSLESGLRVDQTSDYGSFVLPRISFLYTPDESLSLRLGGGLGYKEPSSFNDEAESIKYKNLLPLDTDQLEAEESSGINFDINKSIEFDSGIDLNLNLLLFYTKVDKPLRLSEVSNNQYAFIQSDDYLDTQGFELSSVFKWDDWKYYFGYTHADVEIHQQNKISTAPLMPKERVNNIFVYEREDDFRIGLEAYYYGEQVLTDGSKSRDFWIYGLMMEKIFKNDFSIFLNFENFSDTRQTKFDPIYTGTKLDPIFSEIYAPLDGFVINGGFKIKL